MNFLTICELHQYTVNAYVDIPYSIVLPQTEQFSDDNDV
jgi:hypothetical protein